MITEKEFMKSTKRLALKKAERIWAQKNKDINILNYLYYRYFSRRFIHFVCLHMEQTKGR